MIIEFTVGNFLSFKEKKTFSMEATAITEHEGNVFEAAGHKLLKGAVVYGANASGKSNLVKALDTFERTILNSKKLNSTDPIQVTPYLLNTETRDQPCFFELVFLYEGTYFRYGFEVTQKEVVREWFFEKPKGSEKAIFLRDGDIIEFSKKVKAIGLPKIQVNSNALFLPFLDSFGLFEAKSVFAYLSSRFEASPNVRNYYRAQTLIAASSVPSRELLLSIFQALNLGFDSWKLDSDPNEVFQKLNEVLEKGLKDMANRQHQLRILTLHKVYDEHGKGVDYVEFNLDFDESTGTRKMFDLLGIAVITLVQGGLFAMDEMDANLHPLLTQRIIELFHSPVTNPKNAQLLLTTHDTNLLSYCKYRRDQIWFTEKDHQGATDLYSLAEFKLDDGAKPRSDANYEKQYLQGRYGAIPFIGSVESLVSKSA